MLDTGDAVPADLPLALSSGATATLADYRGQWLVSRDSVKTHQNFIAKQDLGFELVSDADVALCNAFGVIREKTMYGRKVMGIVRSTYLIDPDGAIAHVWQPVKVPGHAQAVLDVLLAHAGT